MHPLTHFLLKNLQAPQGETVPVPVVAAAAMAPPPEDNDDVVLCCEVRLPAANFRRESEVLWPDRC